MNCPRCKKPIAEHEIGAWTDICVAEVVMGVYEVSYPERLPEYSNLFQAAEHVIERVWLNKDSDFNYPLFVGDDLFIEWWNDGEWFVATKPVGVRDGAILARCDGKKTGKPSLPLAICRAALMLATENNK